MLRKINYPCMALAERADAGSGLLLAEHMDNPVQVGGVQPPRQREADEGRHVGDGAVVVLRVLLIGAGLGGVVEGGRDGAQLLEPDGRIVTVVEALQIRLQDAGDEGAVIPELLRTGSVRDAVVRS